jgi:hypothetical protein
MDAAPAPPHSAAPPRPPAPPSSDDDDGAPRRASSRRRPGVDFSRLDAATLRRYRAHYGLDDPGAGAAKAELVPGVARHFAGLAPPDESATLLSFAAAARRRAGVGVAGGR